VLWARQRPGRSAVEQARTRVSARGTAALSARLQSLQFRLSPRERNLATLVAQGCQNKEIATILSIAERTVRLHWNHVCQKLGIASRNELQLMLGVTDKRHSVA
jgi:two-component system response regulator FixJ